MPNAKTDKSVSIIHFQRGYFIAWKEPGGFGKLHIAHLEKAHDTDFFEQEEQVLQNEETAFSPALVSLNDRIYIFWISKEGAIKYIINKDQKNFDKNKINTLKFNSAIKVAYGLTAAVVNNKIFIASHADDKNSLLYSLIETGADGGLKEAMLLKVPGKSSPDYPFVASLRDTAVRMAWRNKDGFIYYATYNSVKNKWSEATAIAASKSKYSPVIFGAPNSDRLFYIWSDPKKDSRVYYATKKMDMAPVKATQLPEWFSASSPVSICDMDNKSFLLAFVGAGQHLYMSYFINYNSASWMRDLLMPLKGNYTLKDIAIPGSHDAGMSVLTAAIGQVSGTINPCNTLTQIQDIAAQLNAGIRMFDLRCGTFNKQVYVKHSSSDCIDSAIGGGFGEKLSNITSAINEFIHKNTGEIVLLSFSHFCEKEIAQHALADSIVAGIGKDIIFKKTSKLLSGLTLKELAGKVIITFENYSGSNDYINSNSIANSSVTFMNFRREYAATNDINKMISKQEAFFDGMKN
ncbi:MAG: hypothetical protein JST13_13775, partial [Bacteroidetes bacterium]|nr:hypothetical protein [Bacteroidota bacterium]